MRHHRTGPPTDLYALGITLYEMLTGRPPFPAEDLSHLLRQHLTAPVPATGHERMDTILQRLLAKSPDERYQMARAVAHDLEHLPAVPGATDRRVTLAAPALVGRQAQLEHLERPSPQRRLVLLQAPPGGGKTRLLDELQQRTKGWCLRGQAATASAPTPLGLFAGVAHEAARRRDLGPLGGVLAETWPELRDVVSQPSLGAEGAAAAALADLLEALGPEALVLLDDVQWADPASLEALARWARVPGSGATVVAACRQGELPRPLGHHEELLLPPLSSQELRSLWESMAGPTASPDLERLEALCEGNPFLAVEGLRGLRTTGELTSARGSALLEQRLESLSAPTRELLARAALVGKQFPLEWLMLHESASRALEEGRRANLLWVGDETAEFAHDRLREALLASLPDPVAVHRQAADWFRQRGDRQAEAYHAHACGDPGAGALALEVARALRARCALGEALQFYEMAPPELEVRLETGEVQAALGRQDEARRHFEGLLTAAPDAWLRARTLLRLGELEYRQSRFRQSTAWLEQALRVLGMPRSRWTVLAPAPTEERFVQLALKVYVQLSATLMHEGKDQLGFLAVMLTAAHLTRRYPDYPEAGVLMGNIAAAYSFIGQTSRARDVVTKALRAAPQPSLERAQVLSRACVPGLCARNPREAQRYLQEAIALLESLADEWELNMARVLLGRLYVAEGRCEEARQLARAILRTSAQANVQSHVWPARALLAQCGDAEDWPPADVDNCVAHCFRAVALAFRQLCLGNPQAACQILQDFRPEPLLVDADHVAVQVWTATAARLCAEQTPFEAGAEREHYYRLARRAVRQALKKAHSFRCHLPHALREAALLARARGHELRARRLLAESLAEAEHYPLELERTRRLGYDFPPPPTVPAPAPVLQRLVEWSRHILTSSTREAVREHLAGAHAELRPDAEVARHLDELASTAYANLEEEEVRQEASRRLEEGRQRLHAVLESAGVALALIAPDGQLLAHNSLFAGLPAQGFVTRLLAAPAGLVEEDDHGQWCGRWSEGRAVVTVTPARPDRWEALARFQEAERRLLDESVQLLVRSLDGYPELQASLDLMQQPVPRAGMQPTRPEPVGPTTVAGGRHSFATGPAR